MIIVSGIPNEASCIYWRQGIPSSLLWAESRPTAPRHGSRNEIEKAVSHAARGEVTACSV
jgi:hypothetical protein